MGGWGSGRWPRTRDGLFEQVRRIDVRQLQREGVLRTGWTGAYSWTTDGKPSASVSLAFVDDVLLLGYEYRPRGAGEPITVERRVHIEWTPCNYGGRRSWFRCPACGHRMAHVFVADERIACRRCLNLRYASQTEGRVDRASRKARRIRARLGGGEDDRASAVEAAADALAHLRAAAARRGGGAAAVPGWHAGVAESLGAPRRLHWLTRCRALEAVMVRPIPQRRSPGRREHRGEARGNHADRRGRAVREVRDRPSGRDSHALWRTTSTTAAGTNYVAARLRAQSSSSSARMIASARGPEPSGNAILGFSL